MVETKQVTLVQLAAELGARLDDQRAGTRTIRGVAPLESAKQDEVSFLANSRYEKHMADTGAGAVIVAKDYAGPRAATSCLMLCDDPYFAFRQAMVLFYGFRRPGFEGVDSRAVIDPTARIADGVRVAAMATISAGAEIGKGTVIYPGAYVGPSCRVGEDCIIYPNVTLYDGTILHDRVTIHAGTSIGHDGFGYATHKCPDGVVRHQKIPQAGWVELEDDVEIGACCTIDRATMGATIVGAGTKFSNLIAIGHGTQMGKGCLLVAQAGIAGSVMVGDYCVFAGQCGVVGHIRIGSGARIGAKAGITNDVEPGQEMLGAPAVPISEAKRAMISSAHLPQLRSAVRRLTRDFRALRRKLGLGEQDDDTPQGREDA